MKLLYLLAVFLLTGCAMQRVGHHVEQAWLEAAVLLEETGQPLSLVAQSVDKPWLLGAAVPLKRQSALPAVLRSTQTFSFSLEVPLPGLDELARRLSLLSGLTVHISPESRLPLALFLPRLSVADEMAGSDLSGGLVFEQLRLPDLLHQLAAVYSVSWRYQAGRIELYRTETRRFSLPLPDAASTINTTVGKVRSDAVLAPNEGVGIGSESSSHLQATVEAFLSRAGTVRVLGAPPNALLVTDTPERLEALGQALERQPALWRLPGTQEGSAATTVPK